jgi:ectoine hydroxylase-related dioxygenase (phytanoyl-CoA dioxygenase family)
VNHIHPEGWLSSAYYASVPAEVDDPTRRSGWLKFGEPRFAVPQLTPFLEVQPKAGRLVLFPSYLWHGTNALQDDAPRLSVAFDAVPSAELD